MAGLMQSMSIVAVLQQGVVLDSRYGLTLDGLLASITREEKLTEYAEQEAGSSMIFSPSSIDGGIGNDNVVEWELPLEKCVSGEGEWHWLCTSGLPLSGWDEFDKVNKGNLPFTDVEPPSVHRLTLYPDIVRAKETMLQVPSQFGLYRGRYRTRITPVLSHTARLLVWRAVGDASTIQRLLINIESVGARRGTGEGRVLEWVIIEEDPQDVFFFGHTNMIGELGRPVPIPCAKNLPSVPWEVGQAGIRPPIFHSAQQRSLALPVKRPISLETVGEEVTHYA